MASVRWGILSTGRIAGAFAHALSLLPDAELIAVGSRSAQSAEEFGARYNVPRRYETYEQLVSDPDVDVIYVASPHSHHYEHMMLCLNAGKSVLCEKAFTINAKQAAECIDLAQAKGLFLMEAMWTRFLPSTVQVWRWLADGVIGEVKMFMADMGFRAEFDAHNRLFNPHLGGGALLDLGIYPISYAFMILGSPEKVTTQANIGLTGVDEQDSYTFTYPNGKMAVLAASLRTETPREAVILGTQGSIRVHYPFYKSERVTLTVNGKEPQTVDLPIEGSGYKYEAAIVMNCLHEGKIESPIMPHNETLRIMKTMDDIRAQWGVKYPGE